MPLSTSLRRGAPSRWQPTAVHERQAREGAMRPRAQGGMGRDPIRGDEAPGVTGPGRPLPARERATMERRFGRDFSQVRVHANHSAAEAIGARAYAYGRDLVFAPGEYAPQLPAGRELLAHELTHLTQQAERGTPAVQKAPKTPAGGIGSAPPSEAFERAADAGPEDSSVLFGFDKADLSGASRKALTDAMGTHKGPVTVQIHGYASSESQDPAQIEYNVNLSAHRAAAVKAFLAGKLPAGSRFVLFAHGETTAFAPTEQNRRAGITIRDGVDTPAEAAKKAGAEAKRDEGKPPNPPGGPGVTNPTITLFPPPAYTLRPMLAPLVPPLGTPPGLADIDWDGLHSKAAARGLRLDPSLAVPLQLHWNYSYNFFFPFLGRDGAIGASNLATNFMFDGWLARENPNAFDRFNKDFKQAHPDEKHLVIPFGSDLLDWVRMRWKGNKKDDYYFRF